jgi:hypothetical protein
LVPLREADDTRIRTGTGTGPFDFIPAEIGHDVNFVLRLLAQATIILANLQIPLLPE